MSRPRLSDEPDYHLNVRVPVSLYDNICAIAYAHGLSLSDVVRFSLGQFCFTKLKVDAKGPHNQADDARPSSPYPQGS